MTQWVIWILVRVQICSLLCAEPLSLRQLFVFEIACWWLELGWKCDMQRLSSGLLLLFLDCLVLLPLLSILKHEEIIVVFGALAALLLNYLNLLRGHLFAAQNSVHSWCVISWKISTCFHVELGCPLSKVTMGQMVLILSPNRSFNQVNWSSCLLVRNSRSS